MRQNCATSTKNPVITSILYSKATFLSFAQLENVAFKLAGAEGLEPSRAVLETAMLPLHHAPIIFMRHLTLEYNSTKVPAMQQFFIL